MKEKLKYALTILGGTLIIVVAIHFFMAPNHFVTGSISGLAVVLVNFIDIPLSAMTLILNVLCLVIAWIFIGREFCMKVMAISLLIPACMYVFELLFPNPGSPTGEMSMDAVCFTMIICLGQAILFQANAASGGMDIIAKVMNKYLHMDLGQALMISGMVPVICSGFAYEIQSVIIGALLTYFSGVVLDSYIADFARKKRVCILSEKHAEIQEFIMHTLKRGVTIYSAMGGYDKKERSELVVILTNKEYGQLLDYLSTTDPKAFITVSDVNRVVGMWNTANRRYF